MPALLAMRAVIKHVTIRKRFGLADGQGAFGATPQRVIFEARDMHFGIRLLHQIADFIVGITRDGLVGYGVIRRAVGVRDTRQTTQGVVAVARFDTGLVGF